MNKKQDSKKNLKWKESKKKNENAEMMNKMEHEFLKKAEEKIMNRPQCELKYRMLKSNHSFLLNFQ